MKADNSKNIYYKFTKTSSLLSIFIMIIGAVVLAGWAGNISVLKSVSPGLPSMKPNTAICFLLAGTTLILLHKELKSKFEVFLIPFFSITIILVGTVTLLQDALHFDAGIDELFFKDNTVTKETGYPGRPAPQTAFCFILSGLSLFLINIKKTNATLFQWLSLASGLLAFFGLIGYLFGAKQLTGFSTFTAMALNTAVGFLCLMLAVLFLFPQTGLMKIISSSTLGGKLFRIGFPLICFMMIFFGWVRLQGELTGLYDTRLGIALYILAFIIVFGFTLFYSSKIIYKSELEERETDETLQKILKEISDYKYALDESSILAITDHQGIIKHVNDNFCKISKYRSEELLGQDHRIINSGYHSKEFFRNLWHTIAQGNIWKGEIKNIAKDGTIYWVDTTIIPFLNKQAKPYQYVAIRADITARKKTEEKLFKLNEDLEQKAWLRANELLIAKGQLAEKSELISFLATIADNIQDPVISSDTNFLITKWNKAAEDLLGWTYEEVVGRSSADVLQASYPGTTRDKIIAALQQNKAWKGEGIYKAKSGEAVNVFVSTSQLKDNMGNVSGYFAIVRDITDHKKAEFEMKRLNKCLVLATASAGMGVWDWDIKNNILSWDDGMFKLYGIDRTNSHSVYDAWISKLHPEDREETDREIQLAIAGIKDYNTGFRIIAGDQSVHYLRATAIFDYDDAGEAMRMIGLNWDITESKRAEAEIKLLNEELEIKILERTGQLETSNKELESFSYSVAHDLRAPLRAVNSYAQILEDDHHQYLDADGKLLLEKIKYNANKMGALIDELLTFSRLGRKEIHKTEININRMLHAIVQDFYQTSEVPVKVQIGTMPAVHADYTLLHQVFVNLLSNAIKYSAKKEFPTVQITTEQQDGKTIFIIKDNGAGFDMRYADKLFGVFQRLHSETEFEGNGVGLAIVRRIITKHGGEVWAEGEENIGATFYFTLN